MFRQSCALVCVVPSRVTTMCRDYNKQKAEDGTQRCSQTPMEHSEYHCVNEMQNVTHLYFISLT